jgi:hypothetical protein
MLTKKSVTKLYDCQHLLALALADLHEKGHRDFKGANYLCGLDKKGFPFIRIQLPEMPKPKN